MALRAFRSWPVDDLSAPPIDAVVPNRGLLIRFGRARRARNHQCREYRRHYENPGDDLETERLGGYIARKQTHMHKLAMIVAASKRDTLVIERDDLIFALSQLNEVEKNMNLIFSYINAPEARAAHRLLQIVEERGKVEKAALYTAVFNSYSYNDYLQAIHGLIASGKVPYRVREIQWGSWRAFRSRGITWFAS